MGGSASEGGRPQRAGEAERFLTGAAGLRPTQDHQAVLTHLTQKTPNAVEEHFGVVRKDWGAMESR